jgi:hypothetical protein
MDRRGEHTVAGRKGALSPLLQGAGGARPISEARVARTTGNAGGGRPLIVGLACVAFVGGVWLGQRFGPTDLAAHSAAGTPTATVILPCPEPEPGEEPGNGRAAPAVETYSYEP